MAECRVGHRGIRKAQNETRCSIANTPSIQYLSTCTLQTGQQIVCVFIYTHLFVYYLTASGRAVSKNCSAFDTPNLSANQKLGVEIDEKLLNHKQAQKSTPLDYAQKAVLWLLLPPCSCIEVAGRSAIAIRGSAGFAGWFEGDTTPRRTKYRKPPTGLP